MKDVDLPRNQWRLGRIEKTSAGSGGLVRKAKIHLGIQLDMKGKRLDKPSINEWPIQKLELLKENN